MRYVVGLLLCLGGGGTVLFFSIGGTRWFSRHIAPVLYDLPGGSWVVGAVLGVISFVGWVGVVSGRFDGSGAVRAGGLPRGARVVVRGVCWVAVLGPIVFLISGLRGRNCRSYEPGCEYVSGTGPAALAYVVIAGGVGWLYYRRRRAAVEERSARERERLRKLRKKGKGRSRRAARGQ